MGTERKAIHDADGYLRNTERRLNQQERRPQIYTAEDILGPGFGPTGTMVLNWNGDEATFNGFFWSPVGALNGPDSANEWGGFVIAEDDNAYGVQEVWSIRDGDPPRRYVRRWSDPGGGGTRTYTAWRGDGDWITTGITGLGAHTVTTHMWKRAGLVVSVRAAVDIGSSISVPTDGNITNEDVAELPAEIRPVGAPYGQALSSGGLGRLAHWTVGASGTVQLVAVSPGPDIDVGDTLTFTGTFLL